MRDSKITVPIVVGIVIVVAGMIMIMIAAGNQEDNKMEVRDTLDRELTPSEEPTAEVQKEYDEIEKTDLENKYSPRPAEWITSGPFQIDRSEYILGEKVFVRIGGLGPEEKGQIAFLRALNSTHYSVYLAIPFDGSTKSAFNYYFPPSLSRVKGICTADELIGDWKVVFRGTDYPNLEFKITKEIMPGKADDFESVC